MTGVALLEVLVCIIAIGTVVLRKQRVLGSWGTERESRAERNEAARFVEVNLILLKHTISDNTDHCRHIELCRDHSLLFRRCESHHSD